jgi:two-component system OmpR family response regulator
MLTICDLKIDLDERRVSRAGQEIALGPREFQLLELLARRRGRVVGSVLIWQHFYGDLTDYEPNRISSYVRALRHKIDKGFDRPLLLTRWGSGYLLWDDGQQGDEEGQFRNNIPVEGAAR